MIDEQRTLELFGYTSNILKPHSAKPIVKVCEECGEYKVMRKCDYKNLCKPCANKQKKCNQLPIPKFVPESKRFLNDSQIDRILTIKQFGYDPKDLSKGSGRKVVYICQKCGKIRNSVFCSNNKLCYNCNLYKSDKTHPNYGKHLSDELKEKIKNGNKNNITSLETKIKISCTLQGISRKDFVGFNKPKYCSKFNESLREQIREKYNRKCFICDKNEQINKRRLDVHHINMNKQQGCNGEQWKLIPVCMSCHPKLHNNLWQSRIEYLLKS